MIVDEAFDVSNGHLAERFALVSPLIKYGISGQALINIANTPSESEDTEPQDDSESQATNNPGSSGGGCNAGVATYALAGLVLFIVRKKS
jgi:hypothetical protein